MIITIAVLFVVALTLIVAFRPILTDTSISAEVSQERSADHYRPMFRLFDESNFEYFIPAGYPRRARLLRRFRAERRSLFRIYLCDLRADHARIVTAIRSLLIESQVDRPDLAITLYRCQFTFALAIVSIEFKLLLHVTGFGSVDARAMVAAMQGLQLQLQDMMFVRAVGYR